MSHHRALPEGADDVPRGPASRDPERYTESGRLRSGVYEEEMARLQEQLVLLQYWIAVAGASRCW